MKNPYLGVIIEESLDDFDVLSRVRIKSTKVEQVTSKHKTPWLSKWTLHSVEIQDGLVDEVVQIISDSLDKNHPWYADFKNNKYHYIVYRNRIFKVDLQNPVLYKSAKEYGISLGIPDYQVDFAPKDNLWVR